MLSKQAVLLIRSADVSHSELLHFERRQMLSYDIPSRVLGHIRHSATWWATSLRGFFPSMGTDGVLNFGQGCRRVAEQNQ